MDINTLSKIASEGSQIAILLNIGDNGDVFSSNVIVGTILSFENDCVILQTSDGLVEVIDCSTIARAKQLTNSRSATEQYDLTNRPQTAADPKEVSSTDDADIDTPSGEDNINVSSGTDESSNNIDENPRYSASNINNSKHDSPSNCVAEPLDRTTNVGSDNSVQTTSASESRLFDIGLIKIRFWGKPHLVFPKPEFDVKICAIKDIRKVVIQCKNIFDNALKIKELSRLTPCSEELEKSARSISSNNVRGHLLYLAGIFSYHGGNITRAYELLEESYTKCSYSQTAYPLAALEIEKGNYEKACGYLALAIKLQNGKDGDELIRTLGQCVMQLDNNVLVPIGSIVDIKDLPQETADMAWMLVYYLLKDYSDAYEAIKNRDVELLRKSKVGNDFFPWELENIPIEPNLEPEPIDIDTEIIRGRISAFYPERGIGFLIEAQTNQTWFFRKDSILDVLLLQSLGEGHRGQEVTFEENDISYGKYPAACSIHLLSADTEFSTTIDSKASLEVRLKSLPKNSSYYAKAKASEQYGDLLEAQRFYQLEIDRGNRSSYFKSAVKDLASLLNRNNKPLDAINLLDKYIKSFAPSEIRSINQMKVTFFIKAKEYENAAQLLRDLAKHLEGNNEKKVSYLQQEAYCYYAMQKYDVAIEKLEKLAKTSHNENVSLFLEKVKQTKEDGESPEQNEIAEIFEDHISELAKLKLEACKFEGLDERSKEYYTEEDIKRVLRLEKNVFGVRPVERSKFLLTAAKISQELEKPDSETNRYLFDYFVSMAEAATYDYLAIPIEVARCYALEALRLGQPESNPRKVQKAWTILLSTYNDPEEDMPLPKDLIMFYNYKENIFSEEVRLLITHVKSWTAFLKDYPYIYKKTQRVIPQLKDAIEKEGATLPVPSNISQADAPRQKVEKLFSLFNDFDNLVTDRFNKIRDDFIKAKQAIESLSNLDRLRIDFLTRQLDGFAKYSAIRAFSSKNNLYHQLREELEMQITECLEKPTTLTIEKMYPVFVKLQDLLDFDFNKLKKQKPNLQLTSVRDFYSIEPDGKISVKLELESKDESAPPIEAIRFYIDDENRDYDEAFYPEPFGYGKKEFEFRFLPTEQEKIERVFSLQLSLQYRSRISENETAGPFALSINLAPPMVGEIVNPYRKYSSGSPVEENDHTMFFGREELVKTISAQLSEHYSGHCFVLYGQKRSGKTSVLRHVGASIPHDTVYTYLSAQNFNYDGRKALNLFVYHLIFSLKIILKSKYSLDFNIKLPENIDNFDGGSPYIYLYKAKEFLCGHGLGWIVAVDEFTYIYSDEKEDVERFMHAWKSMLENKLFNALIIGQDTMPAFKKEYPNDFCVTNDVRITYLDRESVDRMASEPILKDGERRSKGEALDKIYELTAGNPYFLQQMCCRIVDYLNEKKSPYFTGADIDNILDGMIRGDFRLNAENFDSIVTAGDEKMAKIPKMVLWEIMAAIADPSNSPNDGWCNIANLSSIPHYQEAIEDLVNRDSLIREKGQVKIRVGLFSHWLRINK